MRFCFFFVMLPSIYFFFFFNDTATTEIYTLSLHDALPISLHEMVALPDEVELQRIELLGLDQHLLSHADLSEIVERSEEHTSELQSRLHLVCRLLLEKKKKKNTASIYNHMKIAQDSCTITR